MSNLKELREQIEQVDTVIIKGLAKRQKISMKIGKIKAKAGKKILNNKREEYLMRYYNKLSKEYKIQEAFMKKLFKMILTHSRKLQKP